ncbi:MAG: cation:proton antiporter [Terriglobia bacterium]
MLFLAYLANLIELAPIVGAFAAGLILDPVHYQELRHRENNEIEELIGPIASFLVPIFFVLMGVRVELKTFADPSILAFALVLTAMAIAGKQACSLAVLEKGLDRISVGIGMIPRGEVGLIFASMGAALLLKGRPVILSSTYSAIVIMVILTTLVTPPILKASLERGERIKRRKLAGPPPH